MAKRRAPTPVHYTIEVRCQIYKKKQRKVMDIVVGDIARHVYATAILRAGIMPDIALFSDDFYLGRTDLLKDLPIGKRGDA